MQPDIALVTRGEYKGRLVIVEYYNSDKHMYVVRLIDRLRPCLTFEASKLDFDINQGIARSLYG